MIALTPLCRDFFLAALVTNVHRGILSRRPLGTFRQRQAQAEGRALRRMRVDRDRTIVQLHHPICHREADAGASLLRREIKIEYLVAYFRGDPRTFIRDSDD